MANQNELFCSYAALLLADAEVDVTVSSTPYHLTPPYSIFPPSAAYRPLDPSPVPIDLAVSPYFVRVQADNLNKVIAAAGGKVPTYYTAIYEKVCSSPEY